MRLLLEHTEDVVAKNSDGMTVCTGRLLGARGGGRRRMSTRITSMEGARLIQQRALSQLLHVVD
jgi:hypothetical protein